MIFITLLRRLERFWVSKSSSSRKIKYFRKQGMKVGENCRFETMEFSTEPYLIEIGNGVRIATGTLFIAHDAGIGLFSNDFPDFDVFGKITVGDNVVIGAKCTILPNSTIGNNCIVGAGSVVRGKFPDNSVIFGNPAKVFMKMSVLKLLYSKSQGLLKTRKMSDRKKKPIVMEHFAKMELENKNKLESKKA